MHNVTVIHLNCDNEIEIKNIFEYNITTVLALIGIIARKSVSNLQLLNMEEANGFAM